MAATHKSLTNNDLKHVLPVKQGMKLASQVEENIYALDRSGLAGMASVAANYRKLAELWEYNYTKSIHICATSNGKSVTDLCSVEQCLVEGWHKLENDL